MFVSDSCPKILGLCIKNISYLIAGVWVLQVGGILFVFAPRTTPSSLPCKITITNPYTETKENERDKEKSADKVYQRPKTTGHSVK